MTDQKSDVSVKQIEISFGCYIRYQWNFETVVKNASIYDFLN